MTEWEPVVFASDCEACPCCDDVICHQCGEHYADCECIGPTMDETEVEYLEKDGVLFGRHIQQEL